jgi:hypothetical protein
MKEGVPFRCDKIWLLLTLAGPIEALHGIILSLLIADLAKVCSAIDLTTGHRLKN